MAETAKLSDLTPDPRNANRGTERGRYMLEKSLRKLGAGRSIVLDKQGRIIAGNKTAETAGEIGIEDVIIVRTSGNQLVAVMREDLDLDDPTGNARELAYADNRAGQVSLDFDPDVIGADLELGADLSDWWTPGELEDMGVIEREEQDAPPQENRAEELREAWGVELGQLWRLPSRTDGQEHRLICGDCTDADVVGRVTDIDLLMMVTDPPYGVDYEGIENDSPAQLVELLNSAFSCADVVLENGSVFYIFHADVHSYEVAGVIRAVGLRVGRPPVVQWVKDTPVMGRGDYNSQSEPVFYGWKGSPHYFSGEVNSNVWFSKGPQKAEGHPTIKPTGIIQNTIINSSQRGWGVDDPFSGSGTTIIAAENLSRQCRAVEISPAYVAVALQRYQDAFGITPELVS